MSCLALAVLAGGGRGGGLHFRFKTNSVYIHRSSQIYIASSCLSEPLKWKEIKPTTSFGNLPEAGQIVATNLLQSADFYHGNRKGCKTKSSSSFRMTLSWSNTHLGRHLRVFADGYRRARAPPWMWEAPSTQAEGSDNKRRQREKASPEHACLPRTASSASWPPCCELIFCTPPSDVCLPTSKSWGQTNPPSLNLLLLGICWSQKKMIQ